MSAAETLLLLTERLQEAIESENLDLALQLQHERQERIVALTAEPVLSETVIATIQDSDSALRATAQRVRERLATSLKATQGMQILRIPGYVDAPTASFLDQFG